MPLRRAVRPAAALRHAGVAAALLVAAPALQAHPHGALDCALTLGARAMPGAPGDAGAAPLHLAWLDLALTLDAASSAALLPRLPLQGVAPPADAAAARQAMLLAQTVAGLFRQSGWMLLLQPAGPAGTPPLPDLQDPEPPRYTQAADGRLQVQVRLQPAADAPPIALHALQISCRDPVWYWLAGFTTAQAVRVDALPPNTAAQRPGCTATLGELLHQGEQAQALQAAARQAGAPGADQMPEALRQRSDRLAASVRLAC